MPVYESDRQLQGCEIRSADVGSGSVAASHCAIAEVPQPAIPTLLLPNRPTHHPACPM